MRDADHNIETPPAQISELPTTPSAPPKITPGPPTAPAITTSAGVGTATVVNKFAGGVTSRTVTITEAAPPTELSDDGTDSEEGVERDVGAAVRLAATRLGFIWHSPSHALKLLIFEESLKSICIKVVDTTAR